MSAMSSDDSRLETEPATASPDEAAACLTDPWDAEGSARGDELVAMAVQTGETTRWQVERERQREAPGAVT
jgi:hypothetical protein